MNQIEKNEINNENLDIKNIFKTNNISLVLSDISGTGKTRYINNLKRENDNFIYFPLGGYLNKKKLINKLKNKIKIFENKNNIIHIDLYDSLYENLIKEFLFYFLLFKLYREGDDIFNCGLYDRANEKIKIIIELQNTHKNYFNIYKILKFIPIEKKICLENYNMPTFKIENSKNKLVPYMVYLFNDSKIETGEIGLPVKENNLVLPCGIYGKVSKD